jgi:hypothetical protein
MTDKYIATVVIISSPKALIQNAIPTIAMFERQDACTKAPRREVSSIKYAIKCNDKKMNVVAITA